MDGKGGKAYPELTDNADTAYKRGEGRGLKDVYKKVQNREWEGDCESERMIGQAWERRARTGK